MTAKRKTNSNQGITLIALVITIIILLILAGISIASLTGENGILAKAMKAKEESKKAEYKEKIELIITEERIKVEQNGVGEKTFIEIIKEAIEEQGKEWMEEVIICDDNMNDQVAPEECTKIIVETKDGYEIIIEVDNAKIKAEIVSITKGSSEKKDTVNITLKPNGADQSEDRIVVKEKKVETVVENPFTKEGYNFVGWSTKPEEEIDYKLGSKITPTQNMTLYARWEEKITVVVSVNKGKEETNKIEPNTKITVFAQSEKTNIASVKIKIGNIELYTEEVAGKTVQKEITVSKMPNVMELDFYHPYTITGIAISESGIQNIGTKEGIRDYMIKKKSDFKNFSAAIENGHDFTDETIEVIANINNDVYSSDEAVGTPNTPFNGNFKGNSHTISEVQLAVRKERKCFRF